MKEVKLAPPASVPPKSNMPASEGRPERPGDDPLVPTVDRALLRALVRRELGEEGEKLVCRLVHCSKSWSDAHAEILVEEFRRRFSG